MDPTDSQRPPAELLTEGLSELAGFVAMIPELLHITPDSTRLAGCMQDVLDQMRVIVSRLGGNS